MPEITNLSVECNVMNYSEDTGTVSLHQIFIHVTGSIGLPASDFLSTVKNYITFYNFINCKVVN